MVNAQIPSGELNQHKLRHIDKLVKAGTIDKLTTIPHREGLSLRVYPASRKYPNGLITFQGRYRFNGAQQRMDYGHYPHMTLKGAEDAHRALKAKVEQGEDPKITPSQGTLAELVEDFIERRIKKDRQDPVQAIRMLRKELPARMLRAQGHEITQRQISDLLQGIVKRGAPVGANRFLSLLKQMFDYGVERSFIETNPAERITRRSVGGTEQARERHLSFDEIKSLLPQIPLRSIDDPQPHNAVDMHELTKLALWFLLVTGQRSGEVRAMRWSEIDRDKAIWTIPAENSKNGKEHKVPLTSLAFTILEHTVTWGATGVYCFPSPFNANRQMDAKSIARSVKRHIDELGLAVFTPHDLRRTFVSRLADLGAAPHVIEKCVNHSLGGVLAVYNRGDYWPERVAAFEEWNRWLTRNVVEPDSHTPASNVIPFTARRR